MERVPKGGSLRASVSLWFEVAVAVVAVAVAVAVVAVAVRS
jgi:hypothetical protein